MQQEEPPEHCVPLVPEGTSGNMKLDIKCSYCPYKKACYPDMRTFLYSRGPVHLAVVKKEPKVQEINVDGDF